MSSNFVKRLYSTGNYDEIFVGSSVHLAKGVRISTGEYVFLGRTNQLVSGSSHAVIVLLKVSTAGAITAIRHFWDANYLESKGANISYSDITHLLYVTLSYTVSGNGEKTTVLEFLEDLTLTRTKQIGAQVPCADHVTHGGVVPVGTSHFFVVSPRFRTGDTSILLAYLDSDMAVSPTDTNTWQMAAHVSSLGLGLETGQVMHVNAPGASEVQAFIYASNYFYYFGFGLVTPSVNVKKRYRYRTSTNPSGENLDKVAFVTCPDGGYLVVFYSYARDSSRPSVNTISILAKITSSGAVSWYKFFGPSSDNGSVWLYGAGVDTSGNIYVTGYATSAGVSRGIFMKLNASGSPLIQKSLVNAVPYNYEISYTGAVVLPSGTNSACFFLSQTMTGGSRDFVMYNLSSLLTVGADCNPLEDSTLVSIIDIPANSVTSEDIGAITLTDH